MLNWLQKLPRLLDLCLATPCLLCGRMNSSKAGLSADVLCFDCQHQIQQCQIPQCQNSRSAGWQPPLPQFAWGEYRGALKRSLTVLKYDNQPQLARPLGEWLAQSWLLTSDAKPAQTKRLTVIPVPLHPAKQQQRGFNQAELLAESFCSNTGLKLQRQGVVRVRSTEAQHKLSATEREQNLQDAFAVDRSLLRQSPSMVLLVDDIYTTGATARAIQQVLQQQNIGVYGIVTVAQTPRSGSTRSVSR